MIRTAQKLVAALGLVCMSVAGAQAADLCLTLGGGGGTIVGKGFTIPPPNKCKPFNGFENGGLGGLVTGTGCTTSNGGSFILQYSYNNYFASGFGNNNYWESGACNFQFHNDPIPGSGICRGTVGTTSLGGFVVGASLSSCTVAVPPR